MFLKRHRKAQAAQQMRVRDVWEDYGTVLTDEIGPAAGAVVGLVGLPSARQRARATKNTVPRFTARARHSIVIRRHPKAVSERLGHSSTAFTMDTYSAVIPSLGRAAADAADRLFGEEGGR
jgi:integrase